MGYVFTLRSYAIRIYWPSCDWNKF